MNLHVFRVLAYGKKHESLAKNGVLALGAMPGMSNSLRFSRNRLRPRVLVLFSLLAKPSPGALP